MAFFVLILNLLQRGLVTGSADHEVRFWEFELVQDDDYSLTRYLSVVGYSVNDGMNVVSSLLVDTFTFTL